jgi:glycine dehydrogenase subunit 1
LQKLKQDHIIGGYPLERHYPELKNSLLLCATELNSQEEMGRLADKLAEI